MNESSSAHVYSLVDDFFLLFVHLFLCLFVYLFIYLFISFVYLFFTSSKKDYLLLFFALLSSVRSHGVGAASEILVLVTPVRIWVWPLFWQLKFSYLLFFSSFCYCLVIIKGSYGDWTRDLLFTRETHYHCAKPPILLILLVK